MRATLSPLITMLVSGAICLVGETVSAHPSSGIVVDREGAIYFQDAIGRSIWKIDAAGKLTKFYDRMGGHWMALDADGRFSQTSFRFAKRVTPLGAKPAILVADSGVPIAVGRDGNLYYGLSNEDGKVSADRHVRRWCEGRSRRDKIPRHAVQRAGGGGTARSGVVGPRYSCRRMGGHAGAAERRAGDQVSRRSTEKILTALAE